MVSKTAGVMAFKDSLLPLRCASLRTAALHPSWTVKMSLLSVAIKIYFGMTLHADCTFHICSFGCAAIIRSFFYHTARIERFRAQTAVQDGCILLPMQMSDVY